MCVQFPLDRPWRRHASVCVQLPLDMPRRRQTSHSIDASGHLDEQHSHPGLSEALERLSAEDPMARIARDLLVPGRHQDVGVVRLAA